MRIKTILFLSIIPAITVYISSNVSAETLTFESRIVFSEDDAEELADNTVNLISPRLQFMEAGSGVQKAIGLRWRNVPIPQGAIIERATITFTAAKVGSNPVDIKFFGQAADNASKFNATESNISSRLKTAALVKWRRVPSWDARNQSGPAQRTPDLSRIIQEVVDRPGWEEGNNMVIIAKPIWRNSNFGPRVAKSFDANPNNAPLLHVEYTTDANSFLNSTIPNFKVAFVGDTFLTQGTRDLLRLIRDEGAEMLLLLGDLDHANNPDAWEKQINNILGPDFPVFAAIGNHETDKWDIPSGYQQKLSDRLERIEQIEGRPICTGEIGVKSACNYKGLFFILAGIGTWPVVDQRIASSSDDAEERENRTVTITSPDLEFMEEGSGVQRAVGMRWRNVQIPQGAVITKAFISFTVAETGSNPVSIRFQGQAADNPSRFTTDKSSISSRPRTTARIFWTNIPPWDTVGEKKQTPDLSPLIQEIVDRAGWSSGNSMVIIATPSNAPTGPRIAASFDINPAQAPRLHVEYYAPQNEYISYIRNQLALNNSLWRVCAWHKPQRRMQVGGFNDMTGWDVYEECRKGGAIVGTAHSTTYSRTYLMSNFQTQTVDNTLNTLVLEKGKSFDFVNGLGGGGIGSQQIGGSWWASIYASQCLSTSARCRSGATYGALFCTFNINGQPDRANCYFRDINGSIIDDFDLISEVQSTP